jgi:hypothetical protein
MKIVISVELGRGDTGASLLTDGWSQSETGGTWSIRNVSRIMLGRLAAGYDHIVELTVRPFLSAPEVARQTIRAALGSIAIGDATIDQPAILGFRIPGALVTLDGPTVLTLQHRFAARPSDLSSTRDDRWLAVLYEKMRVFRVESSPWAARATSARPVLDTPPGTYSGGVQEEPDSRLADVIQKQLGLSPAQLMLRFESIGSNCEFGLVQRRCGAEPLGLLRFSATPLHRLLAGLANGFEGLGETGAIEPQLHGPRSPREYMIKEKTYELVYHTFHYEDQMDIDTVLKQETMRLKYLRRKLLEDLQTGAKILLCKRDPMLSEAEALALLAAVGQHGPNTLLWVVEAEGGQVPGSVEMVTDRLMKGYIDRFAPGENAHLLSLDCWLQLCANAYAIWPERHFAGH